MEKKTLYTIVGLGVVGLISFQAFSLINNDSDNYQERGRDNNERRQTGDRNGSQNNMNNQNKSSNWARYGLVNVETTFDEQSNFYTSTMTYNVHEDTNSLTLLVSLQDDIIQDIQISHYSDSQTSVNKHALFDRNVNLDQVLGQNIQEAQLSKVTGVSHTSASFNEILVDIANYN